MSDDDDTFDVVSQSSQLAPLPTVPQNQGPQSIPLSVLLDFAIQKTYQELTIKTQLLPSVSDLDRKVEIVQFAHRTRQLFVRLLAVVKWAKSAAKVDVCTAISCFLNQQCSFFVETADSLYQLSKEYLTEARLPVFQIPAAVDVLTLGSYPRLPLCIKTRFVPDDVITPREQACVFQRLNQVIRHRLIAQASNIPAEYIIKNGMVIFRVENEFEATLTLLGEALDTSWTLLNLKILILDYCIGEGADLVHPFQVHYLHQLVQTRLESSQNPILELFDILRSFCLSLQLDIFYCQAQKLIYERLNDNVSVDEYKNGQKLSISYWKNQPITSLPGSNQPIASLQGSNQSNVTCFSSNQAINYRLLIEICENKFSIERKSLRISHVPSSDADLPVYNDYQYEKNRLSIENLLTDTQTKRIRFRLLQIKERLDSILIESESRDLKKITFSSKSQQKFGENCQKMAQNQQKLAQNQNFDANSQKIEILDTFLTLKRKSDFEWTRSRDEEPSIGHVTQLFYDQSAPPKLNVDLLLSKNQTNFLRISVNLFTGRYLCDLPKIENKSLLDDLEKILNFGQWQNLKSTIIDIKLNLFLELCKKSISSIPVQICDHFSLLNQSTSIFRSLSKHKLFLRFNRYDQYLLIIEVVTDGPKNELKINYYLSNLISDENSNNIAINFGSCSTLKTSSLIELDKNLINKRGLKIEMPENEAKKRKIDSNLTEGGTCQNLIDEMISVINLCDHRIPLMLLCQEFDKKGVKYQMIDSETISDCNVLKIIGFSCQNPLFLKESVEKLWTNVVSCTVRLLNDKNRMQWSFEWVFFYPQGLPQVASDQSQMASSQSQTSSNQLQMVSSQSQMTSSQSQMVSSHSQMASSHSQMASSQPQMAFIQSQMSSGQSQTSSGHVTDHQSDTKTRISTRNWPVSQQQDQISKCVDEFLAAVCTFSRMDELIRRFLPAYRKSRDHNRPLESRDQTGQSQQSRDLAAVDLRICTNHKIVLGYGPKKRYLLSVEYRFLEKSYFLALGYSNNEIPDKQQFKPFTNLNPHNLTGYFLQNLLNETQNLALIMQILQSTFWPLYAAQLLPQLPVQMSSDCIPSAGLYQNWPSPLGHIFTILPVSETNYRILYRWNYCLDVLCLSNDCVAIRDGRNNLNSKIAARFSPIIGLKTFFEFHEKLYNGGSLESNYAAAVGSTADHVTQGPAQQQQAPVHSVDSSKSLSPAKSMSTSDLKLFSPDAAPTPSPAVPPSPMTGGHSTAGMASTPGAHQQQQPNPSPACPNLFSQASASGVPLSPAPASNAGLFTPSPGAPLSNACMLMTPSPAQFPQPSPAPFLTSSAQQPHSPVNQVQSPLSALNEFAALSSDSKLPPSVEYASSWGDMSGPPSSSAATPADKDSTPRGSTLAHTPTPNTPSQQHQRMTPSHSSSSLANKQSASSSANFSLAASQRVFKEHNLTPISDAIIVRNSTFLKICTKKSNNNRDLTPLHKFFGTISLFERLYKQMLEKPKMPNAP